MKLTMFEKEFLESIDSRWNYLVKDWDGRIYMYEEEPHMCRNYVGVWTADRGAEYELSALKEVFGDNGFLSGVDWGESNLERNPSGPGQKIFTRMWQIDDLLAQSAVEPRVSFGRRSVAG